MSLRKIGFAIIPLVFIGMIFLAVGSQDCVFNGVEHICTRSTIESSDKVMIAVGLLVIAGVGIALAQSRPKRTRI